MGKYLYCFIKENQKKGLGISKIGGSTSPVHTITVDNISAVVSEVPNIDFDPTRRNTMAHQKVLINVMKDYTVVPVAFGTIASKSSDIENIIKDNYQQFIEQLEYLDDKIELGLRVKWHNEYFDQDIQDNDISNLKESIEGKKEEDVYEEKILLGKLVESSIINKRSSYITNIYDRLSEIAVESKLSDTIPIKTVFNGYFLVKKQDESTFDQIIEDITLQYNNKLIFTYTGPWPPYNFIDASINTASIGV